MSITSTGRPAVIKIKSHGREDEIEAGGAISPGHLLQVDSTGDVVVHARDASAVERLIALEDALQGDIVTTAYADGDKVRVLHALPGDVVQARLAASATAVVIGDELTAETDGTVAIVVTTDETVAIAVEAVNNSAGGTEAFVRIRFV